MRKILSSLTDGRGFDIGLVGLPLAFLFVLSGLPLLYNVLMSFQEVDMFSLGSFIRPFVGFQNYETVAGFLMYRLRKVPKRTDFVTYLGYKFEVVDIDNYKIDQLLVTKVKQDS